MIAKTPQTTYVPINVQIVTGWIFDAVRDKLWLTDASIIGQNLEPQVDKAMSVAFAVVPVRQKIQNLYT